MGNRLNFNPRTREGCDAVYDLFPVLPYRISIHAPVKGATWQAGSFPRPSAYFNPRTREGCDPFTVVL